MKITKTQLRKIIKEEKSKILSEQTSRSAQNLDDHEMYASDDELRVLGEAIGDLEHVAIRVTDLMSEMGLRYGELVALGTHARAVKNSAKELSDTYAVKLDDMLRFR
jgi:hypothetical protein